MEKVALGCLTIGSSGGSQVGGLALKESGIGCVLVPKFDSEKLQLGIAAGGGAPQFMDPIDALTITNAVWTPVKSDATAAAPSLVLVGGRGLGSVAAAANALLPRAFTLGEGVAASKRVPILAALGIRVDSMGSFKVPSLASYLAGFVRGAGKCHGGSFCGIVLRS